jgi:hypothetical protein
MSPTSERLEWIVKCLKEVDDLIEKGNGTREYSEKCNAFQEAEDIMLSIECEFPPAIYKKHEPYDTIYTTAIEPRKQELTEVSK